MGQSQDYETSLVIYAVGFALSLIITVGWLSC